MKVRLIEVYGTDQKPVRVEVYDLDGVHQLDILWDTTDADTKENREAFRTWVNTILKRKQMEPLN